jgi:hypothetical protein
VISTEGEGEEGEKVNLKICLAYTIPGRIDKIFKKYFITNIMKQYFSILFPERPLVIRH